MKKIYSKVKPKNNTEYNQIKVIIFIALTSHYFLSTYSFAAEPVAADRKEIISALTKINKTKSPSSSQRSRNTKIKQFITVLTLANSKNDYIAMAVINNRIGQLHEQSARYQDALAQYEHGMMTLTKQKTESSTKIRNTLSNLRSNDKGYRPSNGQAINTAVYRGGIKNFITALKFSPKSLETEITIVLIMNAGNMYLQQNQFKQANVLYSKALKISLKSNLQLYSRKIHSNLAWSAIKDKKFDKAKIWLQLALKNNYQKTPMIALRQTLLAVGVHLRETGNYSQALKNLLQSEQLYVIAKDNAGRSSAIVHLATTHLLLGHSTIAERYYFQALKLNLLSTNESITWHANGGLAKIYSQRGEFKTAIKHYNLYMKAVTKRTSGYYTDQGKVSILENHQQVRNEFIQTTLKYAQQKNDYQMVRRVIERSRGKILKKLLIKRKRYLSRNTVKKIGTLSAVKFFYGRDNSKFYQNNFTNTASFSTAQMSSAISLGKPDLRSDHTRQSHTSTLTVPTKIKRITPPPVTFLETYTLKNKTIVIVKPPTGKIQGHIIPITQSELNTLIEQYRHALNVSKPRGVLLVSNISGTATNSSISSSNLSEQKISQQLYQLIIAPIKTLLPKNKNETVIIVPHGNLWLLPFAALRSAHGQYLGEQHSLSYAVSEATWRILAKKPRQFNHQNANAWIVGNPKMPKTITRCNQTIAIDRLPGAEQEARQIAALFKHQKASLFIKQQADRLRLDAWHPNYSVLHFATHGVVCTNAPLQSYIIMSKLYSEDISLSKNADTITIKSDPRLPVHLNNAKEITKNIQLQNDSSTINIPDYPGILTAKDILKNFTLNADLVTLSACQTGLGQISGEGVIGFPRAFLTAGARSLLVSLWNIDDQVTKKLMVHFYQNYLKHGNKALALQYAMSSIRQQYPEPKYWAGFTLVGLAE